MRVGLVLTKLPVRFALQWRHQRLLRCRTLATLVDVSQKFPSWQTEYRSVQIDKYGWRVPEFRPADKALNDALYAPSSREELLRVVRRHMGAFSARNLVTAMRTLAVHEKRERPNIVDHDISSVLPARRPAASDLSHRAQIAEGQLVDALSKVLPEEPMPATALAQLTWALANLAQRPPHCKILPALCKRTIEVGNGFSGRDASTILWAAAVLQLGEYKERLIEVVSRAAEINAKRGRLNGHDIALSLWGLAKLGEGGEDGPALELVRAGLGNEHKFSSRSACVAIFGIGLMKRLHSQPEAMAFLQKLVEVVTADASRLTGQMISNACLGAARAGLSGEKARTFYNKMATGATKKWDALIHQNVVNIAWSLAKAEVSTPEAKMYLITMSTKLPRVFAKAEGRHVSSAAWSLARVFYPEDDHALVEDAPRAVLEAIHAALVECTRNLQAWEPWPISMVVYAAVRAGLTMEALKLFPHVIDCLLTRLEEIGLMDIPMLFWSLAKVGVCQSSFSQGSLETFMQLSMRFLRDGVYDGNSTLIVRTVWAIAHLDIKGPADEMIRKVADVAASQVAQSKWANHEAVTVAQALVMRGRYTAKTAAFVRDTFAASTTEVARQAVGVHERKKFSMNLLCIAAALRSDPELYSSWPQSKRPQNVVTAAWLAKHSLRHHEAYPPSFSVSKFQNKVGETLCALGWNNNPKVLLNESIIQQFSADFVVLPGSTARAWHVCLAPRVPGERWSF